MSRPTNSKRRCRTLLLPFSLLALLAGCLVATWPAPVTVAELPETTKTEETTAERRVHTDQSLRAVVDARGSGLYGAPRGTRLQFRLQSTTTYALRRDDAAPQESEMRLRGRLDLIVADRRGDEVLVAARLHDARLELPDGAVTATSREVPAEARRLVEAAGTEVLLRLDAHGAIRGYRFAAALNGDERNFLRALHAALSFPAGDAQAWEGTQDDATGTFAARYTRGAIGGDVTVTREKLRYTAMSQAGGELPEHSVAGRATGTVSRELGWLCAAEVDESLTMQLPVFDMVVHLRQRATLRLSGADRVEPGLAGDPWDGAWAPAAGHTEQVGASAEAAEQQRLAAALQGVDVAMLVDELRQLLAAGEADSQALHATWTKLHRLIALRRDAAGEVAQLLVTGEAKAELGGLLLTALGAAGTDAAQDALLALRGDGRLDPALREAATVSMMQLARPKQEVLATLIGDVRGDQPFGAREATALMLLGTLAPRNDAVLPGGTNALQALLALENRAARAGALDVWLDALGNAATPAIEPHVLRHLAHTDAAVREAAVHALRDLDSQPVLQALLEKARSDAAPAVRARAIATLAPRAAAAPVIRRAALQDQEPAVRRAALQVLGGVAARDRQAREVLQQAAAGDREPELRALAKRLLGAQ